MMTTFSVDRGGYDYQFVDKPSDMLLCKICHLPSKEPHLSVCCGHTFCKSCLDGIKQTKYFQFNNVACPMCCSEKFDTVANKQNERAIKNLRVFCTNKDKGCDWQGEINDISGHLGNSDGCQFEGVKCSNDCSLTLQRQHLPSHVDNECPCREVHCQYCSMLGQHQFIMGEHVDQCAKVPLPCPNNCGVDFILREDMEVHKTTCPFEEIECPNDCSKVLQRQFMASHVEIECPRRKVDCQYCQLSGEYHLIEGQHKEECPKLLINCPNKCEAGSIPREDMEDHRQGCPLEVIECEYYCMGCHVTMARKDRHMHEKEKMEEHLLLTKSELVETKTSCKKMESELQQNHAKINELESELQQSQSKRKELESKVKENNTKMSRFEFELEQNHALMKVLFGEWTMQLNTRAIQLSSGNQVLPVIVRMSGYASKKKNEVYWYSDPFYTEEEGYKIILKTFPDGFSNGKGTHLSVYLYLMEGPYDDMLCWPLKGNFKVTLLNQVNNINHHSVSRNTSGPNRIVSNSGKTKEIWSHPRFINTAALYMLNSYLRNDSLFFEVSEDLDIF